VPSNAELLVSAWRAYAAGDIEALAGRIDPSATWVDDTRVRGDRVCRCRDGARARRRLAGIRATEGWNLEGDAPIEAIEVGRDKVILRLRWQEGPVLMDLHQLYVMRDGRILATNDFWCRDAALADATGEARGE
jgi:ketosteroid isomerase-like protein